MSFLLFVNEVNDPPENFALVYPTINDTIQVSGLVNINSLTEANLFININKVKVLRNLTVFL